MDLFGFSYSGQQEILTLQTTKKQANIRLIAIEMHRNRKNLNGQCLSRIFSAEKTQHFVYRQIALHFFAQYHVHVTVRKGINEPNARLTTNEVVFSGGLFGERAN
jgi:hypothetical protein